MRKLRNTLAMISAALLLTVSFTACGNADEGSEDNNNAGNGTSAAGTSDNTTADGKRVVKVGIGKTVLPFSGLNDDEELEGYDYDLLKEIEPLLADKYQFEYYPDEFSNILIGLDTSLYDVAVHHYGYTAERAEKYLYADEASMYFGNFLVGYSYNIDPLTDDPTSIAGLHIAAQKGSMAETLLTNYNDEHPGQEVIIEDWDDMTVMVDSVRNGLFDGWCASAYDIADNNAKYGDFLIPSEFSLSAADYNCGTYFIYSIGDDELKNDIDAAIVQIRDEGKLLEFSEKWLGGDYTQNPNA